MIVAAACGCAVSGFAPVELAKERTALVSSGAGAACAPVNVRAPKPMSTPFRYVKRLELIASHCSIGRGGGGDAREGTGSPVRADLVVGRNRILQQECHRRNPFHGVSCARHRFVRREAQSGRTGGAGHSALKKRSSWTWARTFSVRARPP